MALSVDLLKLCAEQEIILEVVVGGEEDGAAGSADTPQDKLYTTPEDMVAVHEALGSLGRYMFAATFGNVHGHYKPPSTSKKAEDNLILENPVPVQPSSGTPGSAHGSSQ